MSPIRGIGAVSRNIGIRVASSLLYSECKAPRSQSGRRSDFRRRLRQRSAYRIGGNIWGRSGGYGPVQQRRTGSSRENESRSVCAFHPREHHGAAVSCEGVIHSNGVLHHTPSTERAFASFLAAVRFSGRVYVQLYRKPEPWIGIPNALLRALTSRLPRGHFIACAGRPCPSIRVSFSSLRLRGENSPIASASIGEQALSLFENFIPRYQYRYKPDKVLRCSKRRV
jgi:hypothetical protein